MARTQSASQEFVSVRDIRDSVVIQKNGQLTTILLASSVNFALKSTDEQHAVLQQFQQFLNTLDFSLQIHMRSRRLNIEPYLSVLATLENTQDNDLMRIQLREYMEFIRTFTVDVDVMSKNFFVVISYTPSKITLGKGVGGLFSPRSVTAGLPSDSQFEEERVQLEQRAALVTEGLARIGVRTIALQKDELVELFYHTYNPSDPTGVAPLLES
jgi:type IV secretory pathway VirB4 component